MAPLTEEQISEIRKLSTVGGLTFYDIVNIVNKLNGSEYRLKDCKEDKHELSVFLQILEIYIGPMTVLCLIFTHLSLLSSLSYLLNFLQILSHVSLPLLPKIFLNANA